MKEIKQWFFTYRDGLTADVLRRGGVPHKTIFGLQLPQIKRLAERYAELAPEARLELAERLWADSDVRESRLLACYLFPPELVSPERMEELTATVRDREEADLLRFRLIGRLAD